MPGATMRPLASISSLAVAPSTGRGRAILPFLHPDIDAAARQAGAIDDIAIADNQVVIPPALLPGFVLVSLLGRLAAIFRQPPIQLAWPGPSRITFGLDIRHNSSNSRRMAELSNSSMPTLHPRSVGIKNRHPAGLPQHYVVDRLSAFGNHLARIEVGDGLAIRRATEEEIRPICL